MSIKKVEGRPNTWAIKVVVRIPGAKNPITKREQFTGTKVEAECRKADIIKSLKSNSCGSLTSQEEGIKNFGHAIDLYVGNLRARGRLSEGHERKINRIREELGHLPIDAVADHFETYRRHLMQKKKHSAATLNRPTEIVKAVFNYLVASERIPKNPITTVRFPKFEEKPRDRYLTQEERLRLLDAISEYRPFILPIVQFMMAVPCRVSELVTAKREQYNQSTGTVYIPDSKAGIPMHKPVPEEMAEYFKSIPKNCPYLFYQEIGKDRYRSLTHLRYAWSFCLKKAGIADMRIHDLRHIAATDLYEAGNAERTIMGVAGWLTPMLSNYRHKDSLRDAQGIRFKKSGVRDAA